jgi:hypothetical protein
MIYNYTALIHSLFLFDFFFSDMCDFQIYIKLLSIYVIVIGLIYTLISTCIHVIVNKQSLYSCTCMSVENNRRISDAYKKRETII